MPFPAKAIRILIASPSDVSNERAAAVETIQRWNDLNSESRQIVLLPVRWETHAAPEYGQRPQEIINRQLGDKCDLVVGIFWTRIGTSTGVAESGTLEEIERAAKEDKIVMLYFSTAPQSPESIDLEQLGKIRSFRDGIKDKALFDNFSDLNNFRELFFRQLDIQVRKLVQEEQDPESSVDRVPAERIIDFQFADPKTHLGGVGLRRAVVLTYLNVVDFEKIPDYTGPKQGHNALAGQLNTNYYRQKITAAVLKGAVAAVPFVLTNVGEIGARDVYIELSLLERSKDSSGFTVLGQHQLPTSEPQKVATLWTMSGPSPNAPTELLSEGVVWTWSMEIPALQPQRQVIPANKILIGSKKSVEIEISATIYADILAKPISKQLVLDVEVVTADVNYEEILVSLGEDLPRLAAAD
ncbi:DUF4062 domain-containing protein [Variovorax sp. 22077]|uniref:DUF4062 domain-containing protein n=1 Tax=Variovorax sp. 22077 TaxID=3453867 RepID=UPI003F8709A5